MSKSSYEFSNKIKEEAHIEEIASELVHSEIEVNDRIKVPATSHQIVRNSKS